MRLYLQPELEDKGGGSELYYDGSKLKMSFGCLGENKVVHVTLAELDLTVIGCGKFHTWADSWYQRGHDEEHGFDQPLAITTVLSHILDHFSHAPERFQLFMSELRRTAEEAGREKQRMLVRQQWNELLKALE